MEPRNKLRAQSIRASKQRAAKDWQRGLSNAGVDETVHCAIRAHAGFAIQAAESPDTAATQAASSMQSAELSTHMVLLSDADKQSTTDMSADGPLVGAAVQRRAA